MKKINIAELLKDCPKGMELDCTLYDNIVLDSSSNWIYPIKVTTKDGGTSLNLTKYGCISENKNAKCVIFPKGKTTWEGFIPPCQFKDGDVIYTDNFIAILSHIEENGIVWYHCYYCIYTKNFKAKCDFGIGNINHDEFRFATEEEKEKLFDIIKTNGYYWNAETKTLEVLPKFKVGDKVVVKGYEEMGEDEVICVFNTYDGDIKYKTKNHLDTHYFMEDNLMKVEESNKKETMEEKGDKAKAPVLTGEDYSGKRFGYKIPNGYEFDCIKNNEIILTLKQTEYPKTYAECCKVLGVNSDNFLSIRNLYCDDGDEVTTNYEQDLLDIFDSLWQLKFCRDVYWKIAGEQMGLGKQWEPDWKDSNFKYCLKKMGDNIEKVSEMTISCIFAFPTEEMRDTFFENFKDLIEQCKELL